MSSAVDAAFTPDEPASAPAPEAEAAPEPAEASTAPAASPEKPAAKPPMPRAHEATREALRSQQEAKRLAKELDELKARTTGSDAQIAAWKADPLKAMKDLGIDYSKLTQMIARGEANGVPMTSADVAVEAVRGEMATDRAKLEALLKEQEDRKAADAKAAEDAHRERVRSEAMAFTKAAADKFPIAAEFGFDAIKEAEDYYNDTGEPAGSYDVLAQRAEARMLKELQAMLPRLAKTSAGMALISKLTNTATDTETSYDGAPATAPQPPAHVARKALTSKAAAAASASRGDRERARLPWGNPHKSSAIDEALR